MPQVFVAVTICAGGKLDTAIGELETLQHLKCLIREERVLVVIDQISQRPALMSVWTQDSIEGSGSSVASRDPDVGYSGGLQKIGAMHLVFPRVKGARIPDAISGPNRRSRRSTTAA